MYKCYNYYGDIMFIDVLVEIKAKAIDQTFTYSIPNNLRCNLEIGKRVLVPFGKQKLEGFILKIHNKKPEYKVKDIIQIIDEKPVLNKELLKLGEYIKDKTLCNLITAYSAMLPNALKAKHKVNINKKYITYLRLNKNYDETLIKNDKQKEIVNLLKNKDIPKSELKELSLSSINTLIKNNIVIEIKKEEYRLKTNEEIKNNKHELNDVQKQVIKEIISDEKRPFLLHGVTGSGKTEVYMNVIEYYLNKNKTSIVLVPEISLTPQLVSTFKQRFGTKVAILHSGLSDGEKYDEWRKIERKEVSIVIGARSAIFAPLDNIGVIIIDEEHSLTYKQENNPRYSAIDIALFRMKYHQAKLVLGSATPSIESYTKAKIGKYKLLEMKNRINNNLPKVTLIDMKDEYKKGNRIISEELKNKMIKAINNNEQVMLLLNRRGYSTTTTCKNCGFIYNCPNCDIPLIYHKNSNNSRCHYCGYANKKIVKCPSCGSTDINDTGIGTEKLEQYITNNIENSKVIRMDVDTTSTKGSHERIIKDFENKKYNVLIGTQMISKGLDFSDVSLVGVINADQTLNIPDFRSSERTFELLTQVAGRAGRSSIKGEVIIQGFNIDHYSIVCASRHDYESFYETELNIRKKLKYSPYYNICLIKITGKELNECLNIGNKIVTYLKNKHILDWIILGPSVASIPKINNIYNTHIMIKYKQTDLLKKELIYINDLYRKSKTKVECDLNPLRL